MPGAIQKPTLETLARESGRPELYTDQFLIDALMACHGLVTKAAELIGCSASTIYDRMNKSPEVAAAITKMRDIRVDEAEFQLDLALKRGEPWATSLVLKTLGKSRGYVERTEISGKDGSNLFDSTFVMVIEHGKVPEPIEEVPGQVIDVQKELPETIDVRGDTDST